MRLFHRPKFVNTFQDAENVDATHPYYLYIWIPDEVAAVRNMRCKLYVEKYRTYLDLAESATHTHSIGASGGHDHDIDSQITGIPSSPDWNHTHNISSHSSDAETHTHEIAASGAHTHSLHLDVEENSVLGTANSSMILYDPDDVLVHNFGAVVTGEGSYEAELTTYFQPIAKRGLWYLKMSINSDEARFRTVFMFAGLG